jgi:16S rRNA (guanine966-N2)-methyltransferase
MRIIAGEFRGRTLASVGKGDAAAHLRPTTDRTRESLFNMLSGGRFDDPITDARVLDLFAGTGALGLEALSRGAAHTTFVEMGRKSLALIAQNITLCRATDRTTILRCDTRKLPTCPDAPYDLIFLDPPYGQKLGEAALTTALAQGWIAADALIVWEENTPIPPFPGLTLLESRPYGDTVISLFRKG